MPDENELTILSTPHADFPTWLREVWEKKTEGEQQGMLRLLHALSYPEALFHPARFAPRPHPLFDIGIDWAEGESRSVHFVATKDGEVFSVD